MWKQYLRLKSRDYAPPKAKREGLLFTDRINRTKYHLIRLDDQENVYGRSFNLDWILLRSI
jgi:hypothetical protein